MVSFQSCLRWYHSLSSSSIFSRYPKIQHDHELVETICDTMRAASMNYDDPHQVEEVLDKRLEESHHHALHGSHALQSVADALPAIGIVAAIATPPGISLASVFCQIGRAHV